MTTNNFLIHYGTPKHSGRYPYGSGARPFQGDPHYKYQRSLMESVFREKEELDKWGWANNDSLKALNRYAKTRLADLDKDVERIKDLYANPVVFVSGSSKTQDPNSKYYREKLPERMTDDLDAAMNRGKTIIVGDAPGIDRQVQDYLMSKNYDKVSVYSPGKECRYIANKSWDNKLIDCMAEPGSKEWLAAKDLAMSNNSTEGIAVILDEGANATRRNVERMIAQNKYMKVYQLNKDGSDSEIAKPRDIKALE